MNRIAQRSLYTLLIAVMAAIALYGLAYAHTDADADAVPEFTDSALISRGAYVAKLGDCTSCHTAKKKGGEPFAGGKPMGSPFGTIYTSNITPDPETGIGRYSYADFERVLREGVAPGGKHLYPAMPYPSFVKISDADMRALYAYFMHGVQPVNNQPPKTKLPFPFNQRWGLSVWDLAFIPRGRYKPDDERGAQWNRGAYIVQSLGHCGACHTPRGAAFQVLGYDESSSQYLTGGVDDNWFAPNLTGDPGSGLGRVSEEDIVSFLKTGHGVQMHIVAFGSMVEAVENSTQYINDADLRAIAHYLKSLPAQESSGAYQPHSTAAQQTANWLLTGNIVRPGAGLYMSFCVKCHQADGHGKPGKYPTLAGNPAVLAPDTTSLIRLVLRGGSGPKILPGAKEHKMPAFADKLTDTEIARVLTLVRTSWGNDASAVTTRDVSTLRATLDK